MKVILGYPWPGNVRELSNVIERACILCEGDRLDVAASPGRAPSRQRAAHGAARGGRRVRAPAHRVGAARRRRQPRARRADAGGRSRDPLPPPGEVPALRALSRRNSQICELRAPQAAIPDRQAHVGRRCFRLQTPASLTAGSQLRKTPEGRIPTATTGDCVRRASPRPSLIDADRLKLGTRPAQCCTQRWVKRDTQLGAARKGARPRECGLTERRRRCKRFRRGGWRTAKRGGRPAGRASYRLRQLALSARDVYAVPSFARQTGLACSSCHTVFPELTSFGRAFKLHGYTAQGDEGARRSGDRPGASVEDQPDLPPVGHVAAVDHPHRREAAGYTERQRRVSATAQPLLGRRDHAAHWDLHASDVRQPRWHIWSRQHRHPLCQRHADRREGTRLRPHAEQQPDGGGSVAHHPRLAVAVCQRGLGADAGGRGVDRRPVGDNRWPGSAAYGLWNKHLYGAVAVYRSRTSAAQQPPSSISDDTIRDVAPYWRLAWQQNFGVNYLEVGTFGMFAQLFPTGVSGSTDKYTDFAFDTQFERPLGKDWLSAHVTYIYENQQQRLLPRGRQRGQSQRQAQHVPSGRDLPLAQPTVPGARLLPDHRQLRCSPVQPSARRGQRGRPDADFRQCEWQPRQHRHDRRGQLFPVAERAAVGALHLLLRVQRPHQQLRWVRP